MNQPRYSLPAGTILLDYRLERVLGAGGFGITYLAYDGNLKHHFAIKEYFPFDLTSRQDKTVLPLPEADEAYEQGLRDFILEAQTLARFHHPNIVGVARIFEANNTAYMVLNYEHGESLKERLRESNSRMDQAEIDQIASRLLDAMERMHADGTLHRDIAPDNIYIRDDGSPVLLDFGAAKQAVHARSRSVSAIVKPGYSPQEQYSSQIDRQGPWTDIYSLGATLYRAVSGFVPQDASDRALEDLLQPLSDLKPKGLRPTFLAAIDWALEIAPRDRPQSVADWRPVLLGEAAVPSKSSIKASSPQRSRVGTGVIALALCSILAAASAGATAFYFRHQIGIFLTSTEKQLEELRGQREAARSNSEATRRQLEETRSRTQQELATLAASIQSSKDRAALLQQQLEQSRLDAQNASDAERRSLEEKSATLKDQIKAEQDRAAALAAQQAIMKDDLNSKIRDLEIQLNAEEGETSRILREAEQLRQRNAQPRISFAGLELQPKDASDTYRIAAFAQDGVFKGKLAVNDKLRSLAVNGMSVPLDVEVKRQAIERSLEACDSLTAELDRTQATPAIEARLPQTYRAEAPGNIRTVDGTGLVIGELSTQPERFPVVSVAEGSIAAGAGIQSGDIILGMDGSPINDIASVQNRVVERRSAGGQVSLTILHDCARRDVGLVFEQPVVERQVFGIALRGNRTSGMKIASVASDSPLDGLGLRAGDQPIAIANRGRSFPLNDPAAIERIPSANLCGDISMTYLRNGIEAETHFNTRTDTNAQDLPLTTLGITLAATREPQAYEVRAIDNNVTAMAESGLKPGDILVNLAGYTGSRIGNLTDEEQQDILKRGGTIAVERDCSPTAITYSPAPVEPATPQFTRYRNYDLSGDTYSSDEMGDVGACEAACASTSYCKAYTYDAWNRKCYLKDDFSMLQLNARTTSGALVGMPEPERSNASINFEYFNKKGFPGRGYSTDSAASRDQCEDSCRNDDQCIAFNFRPANGQCDLFDQVGEYFGRPDVRSGSKRQ
ncbi:protein kinase domain-containing protein [Rhizobium leguminosarum]|uniref:protein kinase domain-containing protein n=1 Tax=Rhizobium leguminosarum TaxID=384 RepID=UPI0024B3B593|nr:protein kinase [Rhizobium leguminosarum]WHO82584.1 protein kinase [Rhizobium leguminosarum]